MKHRCRAVVIAACLLGVTVPASASSFRSPAGPVAAEPQRQGDANAGRRALLNAPYVSCGLPYRVYRRVAPPTAPQDMLAEREGRNAELPYYSTAHVNAQGVEIVSSNCLTCHAARFDGELVIGLGNEFLDFTRDPRRSVNEAGAYVRGASETAVWEKWAERIDGIAPYMQTDTVGVNPATNITWALMAHRDPKTLAWSTKPLIEPPPRKPLPVSVPPWWRMQKKHAMFYTTVGRGDHARFMILASMLCADDVAEVAAMDAYGPDIRAFLSSLEPPEYPYPVDQSLANVGKSVFARSCAQCHGTYGDTDEFPNLVVPLAVVGTDPVYAEAATNGSEDRFYEWLSESFYGELARAGPARGYIAPPLDGVWATAPYLHNGSVPDIASLLASQRRPRYWRQRDAPREYDQEALGWKHVELIHGKESAPGASERVRIYDTTLEGYGNGGHTFGDDLTEEERSAVIEYIKTL